MNEAARFAKALSSCGYVVYPCTVSLDHKGDKVPRFAGDGWGQGKYPTDPEEIEALWVGWDGIAINTGRSDLVVADIDVKKGKDGFAAMRLAGIQLPTTPVVADTPTGGQHWFYRMPAGVRVPSDNRGKIADGVDIRAEGAIVFAQPTEVAGLGGYKFRGRPCNTGDLPIFPADLVERLMPRAAVKTAEERPMLTGEDRAHMERVANRILRDLERMEDGTRNATMRERLIRFFGIALSLDWDQHAACSMVRTAYFESGGSDEHMLDTFIAWAIEHARFEVPRSERDEEFEAEVARVIRAEKVREEAKARLNPIRAKDISDDDILTFDPHMSEGEWLVPDLVPRGETVMLFGSPNTGKSFLALDLALGLATGSSVWGGLDVELGKVLYLAAEGTRRLAARRKAWEVFHEADGVNRVQLRKSRLLLGDDRSVVRNADLVRAFEPDLVVVDTFVRATEGLTLENPGEAMRAIAQLDRVRGLWPRATVLTLHHPAKGNPYRPAGSWPIEANLENILHLEEIENGVRELSVRKSRDGRKDWKGYFALQDVTIPGSLISTAVVVPTEKPESDWD